MRGTPWRGMPNPTQPAPEPGPGALLDGVRVVLRPYAGDDQPAGAIVATATTDSEGRFRVVAPPGTYFLCVAGSTAPNVLTTTGKGGKNFAPDDAINTFVVITIGTTTNAVTQDLVVPQASPGRRALSRALC